MKQLLPVLNSYVPTGERDGQARSELLTLMLEPRTSLCSRTNYVPRHLTSSTFIVNPERTHVLANFHGKCLAWMHFGGHWEDAEDTAFETVVQEICQEVFNHDPCDKAPPFHSYGFTSLLNSAPFDMSAGVVDRPDEPKHNHYDFRFLFELPMTSILRKSSESEDIQWLPFSQAKRLWTMDSDIDSYRALLKLSHLMLEA